jgi:hypothetical protein
MSKFWLLLAVVDLQLIQLAAVEQVGFHIKRCDL